MGVKRKAQEAFSKKHHATEVHKAVTTIPVSAFAAAKARSQQTSIAQDNEHTSDDVGPGSNKPVQQNTAHTVTASVVLEDRASTETTPLATQKGTDTQLANIRVQPRGLSEGSNGNIELPLAQNAFVTPLGEYDLEVLSGSVSIYGATLHAKSGRHRVYGLCTHALPQVVARSPDTMIRLSSVVPSMARNLERFSPLFRNIAVPNDHKSSFMLLGRSSEDTLQRSLCILESTKQHQATLTQLAIKSESTNGRMAIACIGGKSTGKSTFARHICNKLLTRANQRRCLFLDLDPGQPEFGPPGQIYLVEVLVPIFGPAYTHLASRRSQKYRLLAAHTIAATSFKDDPRHYMDCVSALFNDKRVTSARRTGSCPVVVNTCGWVSGLGAQILCDILQFDVTDIVLIDISDPAILSAARSKTIYEIDRPSVRVSSRSPADLRQMATMTYFHTRAGAAEHRLTDLPIARWRPWTVSLDDGPGSISAIVSYSQSPSPEFLAEVIDGSIMALVTKNDDSLPSSTNGDDSQLGRTAQGLPYLRANRPLDPRSSHYHGLALVRGIDAVAKQVHLVTPLSLEEIAVLMHKNVVLVRGAFDSPDWAYLEAMYDHGAPELTPDIPWVARREMVGVEGAVWRLRHPPTAARAMYRQ